jgi:hypothetical protein
MASALIKYKGVADILVAGILTFKPSIVYGSFFARAIASWTGMVSFPVIPQAVLVRINVCCFCST